jgi:hypothetical protein
MSPLSKVFELDPKGLNVKAALVILVLLGLPLIVMEALGWSVYWVNLALAGLFVGLSDPGGEFRDRARRMGEIALIGAVLTALAYAIGNEAWELVVLAVFVVTLLSGLAIKFGPRRFAAGFLLTATSPSRPKTRFRPAAVLTNNCPRVPECAELETVAAGVLARKLQMLPAEESPLPRVARLPVLAPMCSSGH